MAKPSQREEWVLRFEDELLPHWAHMLDAASRLCEVSEETRDWFSTFTMGSGVDDGRTVVERCEELRSKLREDRESLVLQLQRSPDDPEARLIFGAWMYALDTMIQRAEGCPTCSWTVVGTEPDDRRDFGGGAITLRRP